MCFMRFGGGWLKEQKYLKVSNSCISTPPKHIYWTTCKLVMMPLMRPVLACGFTKWMCFPVAPFALRFTLTIQSKINGLLDREEFLTLVKTRERVVNVAFNCCGWNPVHEFKVSWVQIGPCFDLCFQSYLTYRPLQNMEPVKLQIFMMPPIRRYIK